MFCPIKDIDVYYEVHGEGMSILIIHGFTPDHHLMKDCLEPIFVHQPGWKRIYVDLPGMGQTRGREWVDNSDKMLQILLEFVQRIIPHQAFLLIGESYGGYLARGIVRQMPSAVTGLCLLCPVIIAETEKRTLPSPVTLIRDDPLLASLSEGEALEFGPMAVVQSPTTWQRFRDEIMVGLKVADMDFLGRLRGSGYPFSFPVDALEQPFEKPTLFLLGRQDASVGYRNAWDVLENYPRATFAVLDLAGHNLQIEQEELFEALVCEWLKRVRLAQGG